MGGYINEVGEGWVAGVDGGEVGEGDEVGWEEEGDELSGREVVDQGGGDKKKLPVFKQPFVSVSAFTHYFTSFVEGCTSVC